MKGLIMIMIGCYLIGEMSGCQTGQGLERNRAIKAGVAKWTINPETGTKEFKYESHD